MSDLSEILTKGTVKPAPFTNQPYSTTSAQPANVTSQPAPTPMPTPTPPPKKSSTTSAATTPNFKPSFSSPSNLVEQNIQKNNQLEANKAASLAQIKTYGGTVLESVEVKDGKVIMRGTQYDPVQSKPKETEPYRGPTYSPANQSTITTAPKKAELPVTQQSTAIPKQPEPPPKKELTSYDLIVSPGEKAFLNVKTAVTPTPGNILNMISGKESPKQAFEERRGQYIKISKQPLKQQALSEAKEIFLESIPGQVVLFEGAGAALSKAGFGIEITNLKGGNVLTTTKSVPKENNLVVTKPGSKLSASELTTESNSYGVSNIIVRRTTPQSKILTNTFSANVGDRSGSLGIVTDVGKTGEVKSSGIAVSRSMKVMENENKDFLSIAKSKYVTGEGSYPGESIALNKQFVKVSAPGMVTDVDSMLSNEGIITTRGIASVGIEQSKGNIGSYIVRDFMPTRNRNIVTGTASDIATVSKVAESEAAVNAAANIPKPVAVKPNIVAHTGAFYSTIGTVAPKSESPIMTIEEQEYRKSTKSEDAWSNVYNPVFGPSPETTTATKLTSATTLASALDKNVIVSQGKELVRDVGRPEKVATDISTATSISTAIAQDIGLDTSISTKTALRIPRIQEITPRTIEAVNRIPPYVPIPTFNLPHKEKKGESRRYRFSPGKYSLKTHPTLTAEQVMKKESRMFYSPIKMSMGDRKLLRSIKGMKRQSFKRVRL